MKIISILTLVLAIASAFGLFTEEWKDYKAKFNKEYSVREDIRRYKIFMENKVRISEHNKRFNDGKESFKMGINQFTDLLPDEMSQFKGFSKKQDIKTMAKKVFKTDRNFSYPDSVDWRDSFCVTPVKNQGQCGASWVFAATGTIESICCIRHRNPVDLSEQNLIDCVEGGCNGGGSVEDAYYYCTDHGIDTEETYNSTGSSNECRFDPDGAQCDCIGYWILTGTEDSLLGAVATEGPVAAVIDASHVSFQMYAGGVYYEPDCSSTLLDHDVLVIGYGSENSEEYWLVKNSWGATWGEAGYIKMARNRDNNCGIATDDTFPEVI